MKRLVTLLLAAGIMLGGATMGTANAVELKAGGQWQFMFGWMDANLAKGDGQDNFYAVQRIRPEFRFVADENLSATLQFEIGQTQFGEGAWGMGADANNAVKFRYGYVDWVVPGVDMKVRMGAQQMKLPQYGPAALVFGGSNDIAGIALSYAPIDELDLNLFWARPVNNSSNATHDTVDVFALAGTYKGDGFKVSPFVMVAEVGTLAYLGDLAQNGSNRGFLGTGLLPANAQAALGTRPDSDMAWWLGIGGELTLFDPFKIGLDFAYGSVDFGKDAAGMSLERKGWMVTALASYKLDMVTPGLALWYGSGDDSNPLDGSERLPYIYQDVNNIGKLGFDSGFYALNKYSQTFEGTWGAQLRFDNISFVENLKHDLRFAYWKGTNDKAMAQYVNVSTAKNVKGLNYLTEEDSAWMLNFDTSYKIYKNLTAELQLAYIKLDMDEGTWGNRDKYDDKMYLAALNLTYKF